jgi:hypothetical protein
MKRLKLFLILATMPEEAFGWLLMSMMSLPGRAPIWPDEMGGFSEESQASVKAARLEAQALMTEPAPTQKVKRR